MREEFKLAIEVPHAVSELNSLHIARVVVGKKPDREVSSEKRSSVLRNAAWLRVSE